MGAYIVLYPHARVYVLFRIIIPIPLPLPAVWMLAVWFAAQLFNLAIAPDAPVAWWAHIGGMAVGAALVVPVPPQGDRALRRPLAAKRFVYPAAARVRGMDVAEMMVNMRATQTQSLVQFAVIKKSHEMQMDLINMLSEVARSAPPPGPGHASRQERLISGLPST